MRYVVLTGLTASGKSELSLKMALALDAEIVSCDSVQIYRGFDIGSAKPQQMVRAQRPHHLLDILNWNEAYDADKYARQARAKIAEINSRGKLALVVGGCGLYLRALQSYNFHTLPKNAALRQELETLSSPELYKQLVAGDPQRAAAIHPNDRYRLLRAMELLKLGGPVAKQCQNIEKTNDKCLSIVLLPAREDLEVKIRKRTARMLESGLREEVASLLAAGCLPTAKPMQSIGYKQVIQGGEDLEERINIATRQYAKKQRTWFRNYEADIRWTGEKMAVEGWLAQIGRLFT